MATAASAGQSGLLRAFETSRAAVVAEVLDTEQIDAHGYRGTLAVETPLVGELPTGTSLPIAWEELSPSRPPRFATGDRVLVALEQLSGASIWLARIPDAKLRTQTLGIRADGDAFLRDPSAASVTALTHYLALSPPLQNGPTGVAALAQLAARGEPRLAMAALERLQSVPQLNAAIVPESAAALVRALLRTDTRAAFADALLELIAERELEALRAPLAARASRTQPPPALLLTALAMLDGGLQPAQSELLLASDVPVEQRRVAARWASGANAPELLGRAAVHDSDPGVRANAVTRLVELKGEGAAAQAAAGLYDEDASVRAATAASLGRLGAAGVPELRAAAEADRGTAAQAAVAGLHLTGSAEGAAALAEIADTHPDPAVRTLARFALGQEIGHEH